MTILICDDKKSEALKLEQVLTESGIPVKIIIFDSGYELLDYIHLGTWVDLCFLDIIMPQMSGIELAQELRVAGFTGEIVFLSTSKDYGPESYTVNAFSYLLKPLNSEKVRDILRKLETKKQQDDAAGILLKISKVARYILFRDISHVEVIRHYVYFRLIDGEEIQLYATFMDIAHKLFCDPRFTQCHRSYIVNMSDIAAIGEREITMRGGRKIPLSKSYPDMKKNFTKWMIGDEKT